MGWKDDCIRDLCHFLRIVVLTSNVGVRDGRTSRLVVMPRHRQVVVQGVVRPFFSVEIYVWLSEMTAPNYYSMYFL